MLLGALDYGGEPLLNVVARFSPHPRRGLQGAESRGTFRCLPVPHGLFIPSWDYSPRLEVQLLQSDEGPLGFQHPRLASEIPSQARGSFDALTLTGRLTW